MPTYTVRIKHELIRYVSLDIDADDIPDAVQQIKDIDVLESPESLASAGEWDVEEDTLSVEQIADEEGTTFADVDALFDTWEETEEAQS
jgi:hypothetical protein